ncbi:MULTISPECIES: hypothetical protein [unclassified Streptomyces]|uniref:hypothetical protein n=1 Tax=unclassified Streptomyces TaxID=2593676 RepID=UPI003412A094
MRCEQEAKPPEGARPLRVSRKSAYQWHVQSLSVRQPGDQMPVQVIAESVEEPVELA